MKKNKFGIKLIELNSDDEFLSCTDLLESYDLSQECSQVGKIEVNSTVGQINLQCQTVTVLMVQNQHDTEYVTVSYKDSASTSVTSRIPAGLFAIFADVKATTGHQINVRSQSTGGDVVYALCGEDPVVS